VTEVGFIGKPKLEGNRFIGPALSNELTREPAAQLPTPFSRRLAKPAGEESLQMS
jgi:hypothetical protein